MLTLEQVMNKSIKKLEGLHSTVKLATVKLIENCYARGINIVITQGYRTIEEQNQLYAQGRTKAGQIVTNAMGGHSNHNFGLAIDFALLIDDKGNVSWNMNTDCNNNKKYDWSEVVDEAKKLGFEWGGDWKTFVDNPHFQMLFGRTTTDYRNGKQPLQSELDRINSILKIKNEPTPDNNVKPDDIKVVVNDKLIGYGCSIDGHVYLPLRKLGEVIGKDVTWDNINKVPYVGGKLVSEFKIVDGSVLVQVRAASELFGAKVSWDNGVKKVYIYK